MSTRGAGQPQWSLNPYEVSLSFAARERASAQAPASGWFGPLDPIAPGAPGDVAGRQWDYPAGYNLWLQPRPQEAVTFGTLRSLADGYDILRLVIETRKDQVARLGWSIKARQTTRAADTGKADALAAFFRTPDGIHTWADWLRMLLEELFVIDAPALYMRRNRAGRLIALMPLDGATIKPVIDAWGRTPQPSGDGAATVYPTAYQQILKGFPAVDYSTRDLLYRPRNPRVNRAYGFSPVEQVVTTVNIALRRQLFLMDYFTDGNIPDSLIGVPETWTPDQIASYQKYWDAYFSGDLARRRRAKFVPGGVAKTFIQTKEPELKSVFDDWLARIVCFAFSVSPQALVQTMNRATAEVQKDLAEEEGLAPILCWVKALVDDILAREFDAADFEFAWTPTETIDPQVQETILSSFTSRGILTINEARAQLGRAPLAAAEADVPMALTGAGYVPLSSEAPVKAGKLDKSGAWSENQHPRWPASAAEGQGGRFAPGGTGSAASRQQITSTRAAYVSDICLRVQAFGGPGMVAYGVYNCGAFNVIVNFGQRIPVKALSVDSPLIQGGNILNDNKP